MVKHSSKPVSGRAWKQKKECRFSSLAKDKQSTSTFGTKMQLKDQKKNVQAILNKIQSDRVAESEAKNARIAENRTRRAENERKQEIVQKITNTKKLKKIKKKHLRSIETR
ncbi:uncharacterized protein LOC134826623 [Bolinopsis microptera]|uniref:uncharacterized protein LOC134826623 n=1 Tax=Bolinopsis microptera TaxID=2820187 RepID=UPI003078ACB1